MTVYSTGEVAALLSRAGTQPLLETHLSHAIRTARFDPPPIRAGRRLWSLAHILAAARHFGVHEHEVRSALLSEGKVQ